jgi:hypothetical protein
MPCGLSLLANPTPEAIRALARSAERNPRSRVDTARLRAIADELDARSRWDEERFAAFRDELGA